MNNDINKVIIERYGVDIQSNIWMEECAELIQAISKVKRYGIETKRDNLLEDIADVNICIRQMMIAFDISLDEILEVEEIKNQRNLERLNNHD